MPLGPYIEPKLYGSNVSAAAETTVDVRIFDIDVQGFSLIR
jgi:hypothetical protein